MGWIIVIFILIVILIVSLVLIFYKKAKKAKPLDSARTISNQPEMDIPLPTLSQTEESIEVLPEDVSHPPRIHKLLTTYNPSIIKQKSYARYDWQKFFEDSIISPFPEDSPALPFLLRANILEREGANRILVEQALTEASKLDVKAVEFYLARWSIIKKRKKLKD
jgi:hypothetical protein